MGISSRLEYLKNNNQKIKGILILDDGGHLFNRMLAGMLHVTHAGVNSIPVVGIEQTSSGVFSSRCALYPVIEVATSAAKQLEAPMLAKLIEQQLSQTIKICLAPYNSEQTPIEFKHLTYGIIGLGNIGMAALAQYQALGFKNIVIFDADPAKLVPLLSRDVTIAQNPVDFLSKADVILGCTGKDFMAPHFIDCLEKMQHPRKFPRIFVSLSSKDTEFNSLLVKIHQDNRNGPIDPLKNIFYPKLNPHSIVLGAGMPFNFLPVNSGSLEYSIPQDDIQLTRGLLAAAIIQAYNMMQSNYSRIAKQYSLDAQWQSFIVKTWLELTHRNRIPEFNDLEWIEANSGGEAFPPA
ncbi:MAG: NAD(P)-binding domain-containing protein [Pseudomonadota bacterium]|nr:NAD(P)-binding domain-containing protein [Pseudomonadota bacterium]